MINKIMGRKEGGGAVSTFSPRDWGKQRMSVEQVYT